MLLLRLGLGGVMCVDFIFDLLCERGLLVNAVWCVKGIVPVGWNECRSDVVLVLSIIVMLGCM